MKLIPPPPPLRGSELAVSQRVVVVTLRHGVLSGCVICGHSTITYWPWEERFHPLHEGCIARLFDHWAAMMSTGDETEDGPRAERAPARVERRGRSAYERRAAKAGAPVISSAVAPIIPAPVQRNPWWRPGMAPDAPWTVMTESTVGRTHSPSQGPERADTVLRFQESLAGQDRDDGVILLGGCIVAPDGSIRADWGAYAPPFGPPLFRPLGKVGGGNPETHGWERCRGNCRSWLWPGRWIVESIRQCAVCAAPDDDMRPWPVEPSPPGGMSEPPPPPKKKAKEKAVALD